MADGVRAFLLLVISALNCASALAQAPRHLQQTFELNIPRTGMTAAMQAFSTQSGLNVGYFPDNEEREQMLIGPLAGRFTANEALDQLLMGTEVKYEWLNEKSLYVFFPKEGTSSGSPLVPPDPITAASHSKTNRRPVESGTVIVIGSRIDVNAPSTEIQSETIELYGASTLAEVLRYLPQIPFVNGADSRLTGEQYADLRGLGTTVVLINGRRIAATATSFDSGGFDLNTLPLTAIKRIEVLLDPSIAYGADAAGGMINIVLQNEIPEPIVQARFGSANRGAEEGQASVSFGLDRDRLRVAVTLDVFHRAFLVGRERDRTNNQDFRRFGGPDARSLESSPPNISSMTNMNLPGLASNYAAVPDGGSNLTIADFALTQGQRNLVSPNRWRSIGPRSTKISAVSIAELDLTDDLTLLGEFEGIKRRHEMQIGPPTISNIVVPATNPWNPFHEAVKVNGILEGVGSTQYVADTSLARGVLSVRATLDEWLIAGSASMHEENARLWSENTIDYAKVMQAVSATASSDALNLFRDGPAGSPSLLRSLIAARHVDSFASELVDVQLQTRGPIAELPAGKVVLQFGGDWTRRGLSAPAARMGSRHSTTSAASGELRVPLIAPEMKLLAMQELEIAVGLRFDQGNPEAENLSTQYALSWRPLSAVSVRASYRDLWRVPNLYDLHQPRYTIPSFQWPDPKRGNQLATFAVYGGGNHALSSSSGRAWSVSMEIEPVDSTKLSLSYWQTVILDRITYQSIPFFVQRESTFPDRVARADPTLQDIQLGFPGAIQSVDVSGGNFGELVAKGMDFDFQSSWPTNFGRLSPRLAAAWNYSFKTKDAPGMEPQQRVGVASNLGTIPRWRAVSSLEWSHDAWTLFSAVRFIGRYGDSFVGTKTGRTIPASYELDVQASARLDAYTDFTLLQGMVAKIGATNLLDEQPAYAQVYGPFGYDIRLGDLRQRFCYLMLEKRF